jgi:hypothetical protein
MSNFREDMRVVVIGENNEIRKGTIKNVHDDIETAIVTMDDGNVEKVKFSNMGIDREKNQVVEEIPEVKSDIQEDAKVITKDQFGDALCYLTGPDGMLEGIPKDEADKLDPMSLMIKGMTVLIVGKEIEKKLYQDKEEIEITKDQLREVIVENCNPDAIAKSIDNEMSADKVLPIAILSTLLLLKLTTIFFDDSKND